MGAINIYVDGSFRTKLDRKFSAIHGGHAQAVAEAIECLSGEFLSDAIRLDHELQAQGKEPEFGFGKNPNYDF